MGGEGGVARIPALNVAPIHKIVSPALGCARSDESWRKRFWSSLKREVVINVFIIDQYGLNHTFIYIFLYIYVLVCAREGVSGLWTACFYKQLAQTSFKVRMAHVSYMIQDEWWVLVWWGINYRIGSPG